MAPVTVKASRFLGLGFRVRRTFRHVWLCFCLFSCLLVCLFFGLCFLACLFVWLFDIVMYLHLLGVGQGVGRVLLFDSSWSR